MLIDVDKLANLLTTDDQERLAKLSKRARVKSAVMPGLKQTKKEKLAVELKEAIKATNSELRTALEGWVDACQQDLKGKGLTAYKVRVFEKAVDDFAKGDLDLALKIVEIAAMHNYIEIQWAINTFNKSYSQQFYQRNIPTNTSVRNVRVSDEVF